MKFENLDIYNLVKAIKYIKISYDKVYESNSIPEENKLVRTDLRLAEKLACKGSSHRKFMRQIFVSVIITAPWYWWKQYHTYKVGTTENSTSMMHTLGNKKLTMEDFSWKKKTKEREQLIKSLNSLIEKYNLTGNEKYWYELNSLMPGSFLYTKHATMNYETINNMYHQRYNHRLKEWTEFCKWVRSELPYADELIIRQGI